MNRKTNIKLFFRRILDRLLKDYIRRDELADIIGSRNDCARSMLKGMNSAMTFGKKGTEEICNSENTAPRQMDSEGSLAMEVEKLRSEISELRMLLNSATVGKREAVEELCRIRGNIAKEKYRIACGKYMDEILEMIQQCYTLFEEQSDQDNILQELQNQQNIFSPSKKAKCVKDCAPPLAIDVSTSELVLDEESLRRKARNEFNSINWQVNPIDWTIPTEKLIYDLNLLESTLTRDAYDSERKLGECRRIWNRTVERLDRFGISLIPFQSAEEQNDFDHIEGECLPAVYYSGEGTRMLIKRGNHYTS